MNNNGKLHVTKLKLIYLLIYVIINFILLSTFIFYEHEANRLQIINIVSLLQIFLSLLILKKYNFSYLSLPILFILISYLFHLGQLPLLAFNIDADMPWPVYELIGEDVFIKSVIFVLKVHFFLMVGILIFSLRKRNNIVLKTQFEKYELNRIYIIGILFVIVGILPTFYYEIKKLLVFMAQGYGSTGIAPSGVVTVVIGMFYIGILLVMIGKKDDIKFCNRLFLAMLILFGLMMLSGSRGEKVVRLLMMSIVYFSIVRKDRIKISTVLTFVGIGYIGIAFVNFISDIRMDEFTSYSSYFDKLTDSLVNFPIFNAMGEFGGTLITVGYSKMFFPYYEDYLFGQSYLKGFSMILLNIGGLIDMFRDEIIYVYNFPSRYQTALGGSYIGELYTNFGNFGSVFAFFIGTFIAGLSNRFERYISTGNWIKYSVVIIIYSRLLWWIRDYYGNMIREIIWISGLVIIINIIFKKIYGPKHLSKKEL